MVRGAALDGEVRVLAVKEADKTPSGEAAVKAEKTGRVETDPQPSSVSGRFDCTAARSAE